MWNAKATPTTDTTPTRRRDTGTRWDYVDRHGCTAHLPWVTTPDGRNARAVHGNFAPRELRADMELDVRAIPGSHKFVATGAPHHGQAFGSLVIFDPHVEDDDAMAPVKRLTPEVDFPETQGGAQVYGIAWPLSEDYYLCVYDVGMRPGSGSQGKEHLRGDYGIYLIDAFGNKELIYRDPEIACQSPIPLRPGCIPPVVPDAAERLAAEQNAEATLAVINVYDSLTPWPEGTKIKALRIYQIIPMSVPSGEPPHETILRMPTAADSVVLARYVLGTVPVEEDGSAHFTVPARSWCVRVVTSPAIAPPKRFGPCRSHCGANRRSWNQTWTAQTRSAIRAWSSPCSTNTARGVIRKIMIKRPGWIERL